MKCIQCGVDNILKERTANYGRCKNCSHPFAFEPTSMATSVKVTDPMFAKAIMDISANNTLYFTPKQLLYFLDKRLKRKALIPTLAWIFAYLFITIIIGEILSQMVGDSVFFLKAAILVSVVFIILLFKNSRFSKSSYQNPRNNATSLQIIRGIILAIGILSSFPTNSFFIFAASVILGML